MFFSNWNKEPDEEKNYRWTEVFHNFDNSKWKMHTGARAKLYIYLYISLSLSLYIYIYIYISFLLEVYLNISVTCYAKRKNNLYSHFINM